MQDYIEDKVDIKGIIPALALAEFDTEANLEEVLPQEVVSLVQSIAPEFGDGNLTYTFDDEGGVLHFTLEGVNAQFCALNINPYDKWDTQRPSDYFVLRSIISTDALPADVVTDMNKAHPHIKFYADEGNVIAEEAYYLTHGIPVLNLMDRFNSFLLTVNTVVADSVGMPN